MTTEDILHEHATTMTDHITKATMALQVASSDVRHLLGWSAVSTGTMNVCRHLETMNDTRLKNGLLAGIAFTIVSRTLTHAIECTTRWNETSTTDHEIGNGMEEMSIGAMKMTPCSWNERENGGTAVMIGEEVRNNNEIRGHSRLHTL